MANKRSILDFKKVRSESTVGAVYEYKNNCSKIALPISSQLRNDLISKVLNCIVKGAKTLMALALYLSILWSFGFIYSAPSKIYDFISGIFTRSKSVESRSWLEGENLFFEFKAGSCSTNVEDELRSIVIRKVRDDIFREAETNGLDLGADVLVDYVEQNPNAPLRLFIENIHALERRDAINYDRSTCKLTFYMNYRRYLSLVSYTLNELQVLESVPQLQKI